MESAELVVVRVVPTRMWHGLVDDEVAGKAHVARRPDGRYFVAVDAWRTEVFDALLDAVLHDLPRDLSTLVAEGDADELARWQRRGFEERRRDDEYEIPLDGADRAVVHVPAGYELLPATAVDVDDLRRLDDEVRQHMPGTSGWVNDPDEFAASALTSPFVDEATSLVAVEMATGAHAGLVRLAIARRWARLGLLGVRRDHARQGLGRALLTAAFRPLPGRGIEVAVAEADAGNSAARALLAGFGARRTGGTVELLRQP